MVLGKRKGRLASSATRKRIRRSRPQTPMARIKSNTAMVRPGLGFPNTRKVTLKYCDTARVNVGGYNEFLFSCNNCHDPNYTGTGHQPLGWDQWKTFYERYTVEASRIRVHALREASSNTEVAVVGIVLADTATAVSSDWRYLCEQPNACWKALAPDWDNAHSCQTLFAKFDAKKFFNLKDVKDNELRIGGATSGAPSDEVWFRLYAQGADTTADLTCTFVVEIEYDVIFSDPVELAPS